MIMLIASCKPEIKLCTGRIKKLTDSTLVLNIDKRDFKFDITKAKYDSGAVMEKDSVMIRYIGNIHKDAHAVLIKLIPASRIIDIEKDTTTELLTTPASQNEMKRFKDFVKKYDKQKK